MPEKQSNKDRLKEITDSIEAGIRELFQSEKYLQYLKTMSRFHKYSLNNTILIFQQRPDATCVCGYSKWRDQFSRHVLNGERGIQILAPTPYKKKIQEEKLDPDTKLPMLDADGKIILEEKEIKIPMYKPVYVYDYAQTEGKPLPTLVESLTGSVENYPVFLEALRRSAPVPIQFQPLDPGTDGYFSLTDQTITLREGMSEVQTICAAVHEIAHALLHNRTKEPEPEPTWKVVMVSEGGTKYDFSSGFKTEAEAEAFAASEDWHHVDENQFEWRLEVEEDDSAVKAAARSRNTEEVQAESIAYAVCSYYGIETAGNSFGYILTWSKDKELPELRASLEVINKTAGSLISDIDRHYAEIRKEQGLDKGEPELSMLPDPTVSQEALAEYGYTDENMLPLSKERAMELFQRDIPVFMLYEGGGEGMAFEPEDIELHSGPFGVLREDWETVRGTVPPMDIPELTPQQKMEQIFQNAPGDSFAIFQLKDRPEQARLLFMNSDYWAQQGIPITRKHYELCYTAPLARSGSTAQTLEGLYYTFNQERPADFTGHSLSVGDVVALKQGGEVTYHFVDSFGYKELPGFLQPENYLKTAEMQMEDDYSMLDGIVNNGSAPTVADLEAQAKAGQPISVLELADAAKRERQQEQKPKEKAEKRPSVLAQLRDPNLRNRTEPRVPKRKEAERE